MKRLFAIVIMAFPLLFACTPENNNNGGGSQNNPEELTITGEAIDVTDYSATLTGYANLPFELGDAEVGIMYDKVKSFEAAKKVVATGLDGNNKFTVTATGLEPITTYYFKSYVQNGMAVKYGAVKSFTTKESTIPAGAVDLGIVFTRDDGTSYSLYWADRNIGASSPEERGDYYAWGETETKEDYSWSTYKWGTSETSLTKYNTNSSRGTVDNKTVLEPEDDVAHQKYGGAWRMPTSLEYRTLIENCTFTFVSKNGIDGFELKNSSGGNTNSIFMPLTGEIWGDELSSNNWRVSLWTASSFGVFAQTFANYKDKNNPQLAVMDRCTGAPIRAVYEKER